MLVDTNVLLYATDEESPFHAKASEWLTSNLNGPKRVAVPWQSLWAFIRIATHPRASTEPLTPAEAWEHVAAWLEAPAAWIPLPGRGHSEILQRLLIELDLRGPLVSDATLAALCIEHGLTMVSADSDFARFTEIQWVNPVA